MDLDAFVATHRDEWDRLRRLVDDSHRRGRLTGEDAETLVRLYQRAGTHLSLLRTRSPDPVVLASLSRLVADGRSAVTGSHVAAWREVGRFFTVSFPAAVYRSRTWWIPTALVSLAVAFSLGWWVATHPDVQRGLLPPHVVRELVATDFSHYYSAHPARDFAGQVWTNNVVVAAETLVGGLLLGVPTVLALFENMVNVGVQGGYLVAAGRSREFFGLILPHGILELTAVFVAAGAGLRLGWTVIDPGPHRRVDALAATGRATITITLGLVVVLAASGVIEAFVTPSGLPTWARIGIGVIAEVGFLTYIWTFGRRAVRSGETGDLELELRGDLAEVAG
jgi:uncharacterized membrane protein SpoIIM required for sporulation